MCCFSNVLIELEGSQTKVGGNVIVAEKSKLLLLSPLTKEFVAQGGNWTHQSGTIESVAEFENGMP
jgi:hypothetical protein